MNEFNIKNGFISNSNSLITGNLDVTGNLNVTGNTRLQALTATGFTVNGNLTVTGNTTSNTLSATTITGGTFYGNGSGLTNIPISVITNLQSSLDNKFDKSGGTVNGNVVITGDVTILGTATTINTQTLSVSDNVVTLNANYSAGTPFFGHSGIEVLRGSATTVAMLWEEQNSQWEAGYHGSTKKVILSDDSLSLLNSGHTHPISEIVNLQSSLDNKYDKSGGLITGDVTINGVLYLSGASESKITGFDLPMYLETPELRIGSTGSTSTNLFGYGKTSDGNTIIDLISETTNLYGTRLLRGAGANGITEFVHKGTGDFNIGTVDLSSIFFYVNDAIGMLIRNDGNVGINTASPSEKLHVIGNVTIDGGLGINKLPSYTLDILSSGGTSSLYYSDTTTTSQGINLSGQTDGIYYMGVEATDVGTIRFGVVGKNQTTTSVYGKTGDSFVYSSVVSNGLNISSSPGTGTEDYIRLYAGSNASFSVPDVHIQGSGSTRGYVGIGLSNPTEKLTVSGNTTVYGALSATTVSGDGSGLYNLPFNYGLATAISNFNFLT